eukprot:205325-Chlamydomonas_euryale.AAC.1
MAVAESPAAPATYVGGGSNYQGAAERRATVATEQWFGGTQATHWRGIPQLLSSCPRRRRPSGTRRPMHAVANGQQG